MVFCIFALLKRRSDRGRGRSPRRAPGRGPAGLRAEPQPPQAALPPPVGASPRAHERPSRARRARGGPKAAATQKSRRLSPGFRRVSGQFRRSVLINSAIGGNLPYPYFPIYSLDKWRLVFDIFLHIIRIKRCPFFFNAAVFTYGFGVGTQIVPKSKMPF